MLAQGQGMLAFQPILLSGGINIQTGYFEELKGDSNPAVGGKIGPKDNFAMAS